MRCDAKVLYRGEARRSEPLVLFHYVFRSFILSSFCVPWRGHVSVIYVVTLFILTHDAFAVGSMTIPSALNLIVQLFPEPREQSLAIAIFGASGAIGNSEPNYFTFGWAICHSNYRP